MNTSKHYQTLTTDNGFAVALMDSHRFERHVDGWFASLAEAHNFMAAEYADRWVAKVAGVSNQLAVARNVLRNRRANGSAAEVQHSYAVVCALLAKLNTMGAVEAGARWAEVGA